MSTIPVIDLDGKYAATDLLAAAATYGFIYVKHNGNLAVTPKDVDGIFDTSKEFFAAPELVKAQCPITMASSGKNRGWMPIRGETLDPAHQKKGDFKESFIFGVPLEGKAQQPLPDTLRPREEQLVHFFEGCHSLCNRIMDLLAEALKISNEDGKLAADWFSSRHDNGRGLSGSNLSLIHYPKLPDTLQSVDEDDIRAGAHTDYGSITLLFRLPNQPGLEILTPEEQWVAVPPNPPSSSDSLLPILVNIGDILSYWTNGLLKSTVHRVTFPAASTGTGEDRYSIAYFAHPLDDAEVVEVPSEMVTARRAMFQTSVSGMKAMTVKDHVSKKLADTYGNLAKAQEVRAQAA